MTEDLTPTDTIEADEALDNMFEEPEAPDTIDSDPDEGQPEEESEEGQLRGEDGRFEKPETDDADDGQGDEPPEAPPEGSAESEDGETAPEPEPVVEETPAVEFAYNADGEAHAIPGSLYDPDKGLFIPPEQVEAARRLFSSGKAMDGSFKQRLQDQNQDTVKANTRADASEKALQEIVGYFDNLIDTDTIADFLSDQQQNWDVLKERAKRAESDFLRTSAETELEGYRNNAESARIEPMVINQLQETVGQYGDALGLNQTQKEAVVSQLRSDRYRPMLYRQINEQEAIDNNMKAGEMAFDYGLVSEMAKLVAAQGVSNEPTPAAPSKAVQTAKQQNLAGKVVDSKNTAPPVVASTKGTAPTKQRQKVDMSKVRPEDQTEAIDQMFDDGDLF